MDTLSDLADAKMVLDLAECVKSIHPENRWRQAADKAFLGLLGYIDEINTSLPCYQKLKEVFLGIERAVEQAHKLSCEEKQMVSSLLSDMEKSGILHNETKRNMVVESQGTIGLLTSQYHEYLHRTEPITIPVSRADAIYAPNYSSRNNDVHSLSAAAKEVYLASERASPENIQILEDLIVARHKSAQVAGRRCRVCLCANAVYKCCVYRSLEHGTMMASSPESVIDQLDRVVEMLKPQTEKELEMIKAEKYADGFGHDVAIWDLHFYMGRIKAKTCGLNASTLSQYFSLGNCIKGLQILADNLFGCSLVLTTMGRKESWLGTTRSLLQKMELREKDGGALIGVMYLDLFQVVGCFSERKANEGRSGYVFHTMLQGVNARGPHYPNVKGNEGPDRSQSQIRFRGPLDFVETPSHVIEKFAYDHRYLKLFAKHYRTGETISSDTVSKLRKSKRLFHAIDTLNSVYRAKVDQLLCGPPSARSQGHSQASSIDHSSIVRSVMEEILPVELPEQPLWQTRFEHFTHYAGSYYSYLYGTMFAEQVWQSVFEDDPLSSEAGERYRRTVLEPGASKDPKALLEDVLGSPELDISRAANLNIIFDALTLNESIRYQKLTAVRGCTIFVAVADISISIWAFATLIRRSFPPFALANSYVVLTLLWMVALLISSISGAIEGFDPVDRKLITLFSVQTVFTMIDARSAYLWRKEAEKKEVGKDDYYNCADHIGPGHAIGSIISAALLALVLTMLLAF
eukprot:jgi/Bigna1/73375/fgenesh1_pg.24_\